MDRNNDQGSVGATIVAVLALSAVVVLLYLPLFLD